MTIAIPSTVMVAADVSGSHRVMSSPSPWKRDMKRLA